MTEKELLTDLHMTKKEIRAAVLKRREELSPFEREKAAVLLTERILGHQWFYGSDVLLGFASYGSEIDTTEILKEALRMGKQVYLPRVIQTAGETRMEFYRVCSLTELQPGYKGIPEPAGDSEVYSYNSTLAKRTLILMPGVAFDGYRNRIGYGKGFYDRYLTDKEDLQLRSIGVGFACQMTEELPCEENDIRPYQVICV